MNKILLLKTSLWAGAIFDSNLLFQILSPEIGGMIFGILSLPSFVSAREHAITMHIHPRKG